MLFVIAIYDGGPTAFRGFLYGFLDLWTIKQLYSGPISLAVLVKGSVIVNNSSQHGRHQRLLR